MSFVIKAQSHHEQTVLEKAIIDSVFVFGKWTEKRETELHLKYLGEIKSKDGKVFKIINSCYYWGLSKRATSRILIFNKKNQPIGNFKLNMTYELPDRIENEKLIFINNSESIDCDKVLVAKIGFEKGIPLQIFLECSGNIYTFEKFE